MRFDEQSTTYLKKVASDLRGALEIEDDYDIVVKCVRHVARQIDALLDLKGYDSDMPPAIHKQERIRYPTASDETFLGENLDRPHRIPGYFHYYASPLGRIWSYKKGRWLKPNTQSGKPRVTLQRRGFVHSESVARLVLLTHDIGEIGGKIGSKIGYRDADPMNCDISNLYWRVD